MATSPRRKKVVRLAPPPSRHVAVSPDVVEVAKDLLRRARKGEINQLAFVAIRARTPVNIERMENGCVGCYIYDHAESIVGNMEVLKARLLRQTLDNIEKELGA